MFSSLRNYSKIIIIIIAVAMVVTGALMGFGSYMRNDTTSADMKPYIAKVNDTKIPHETYLAVLRNRAAQTSQLSSSQYLPFKSSILESMIEREVILQKAEEMGIESTVTEEDLEKTIQNILEQNEMTQEELIKKLSEQGYSFDKFKDDLKTDLDTNSIIQQTIEKSYDKVTVSEEEIKKAYEEQEYEEEFTEVKDKIKDSLLNQKRNTAFQNWLESAKAEAEIEITDPSLNGFNALKEGNYDKAISELNKAIESNPYPSLYVYLAEAYEGKGEREDALNSYTTAVEQFPEDWELHYNYGNFLSKIEERDKAISQYDKASELAGENFMAHYQLYIAYNRLEAKDKAEKEMEILKEMQKKYQEQQEEKDNTETTTEGQQDTKKAE